MTFQKPFLLLLLGILVAGCGQDQYAIERQYYRVQQQAKNIFTNPDATPPNELATTVDALNEFMLKYPTSNIAVESQFTIAQLYVVTKAYDKAHEQLKKIKSAFDKVDVIGAEAVFMRGAAYEDEKNWAAALEQYQAVIKSYPITPKGMETPYYIAMHYKSKLQPDKMMEALREAIDHYKALTAQYPGTPLALRAQALIAQCFVELKEPENAISVLQAAAEAFKGKVPTDGMFLDIATIYYAQLKAADKAVAVLEKVIQGGPKTQAGEIARRMIQKIKEEKK
ncbi:MAG: tetratricopeptide repeat protein [Candidatus Omnitrophica bacterium]|nr:tetratricopeptide repeat protein [Candidatus Omnitrophota bacterium]